MSGSPVGGAHGSCAAARPLERARPGVLEGVVRRGVGEAGAVAAHGLDPGGDEHVALPGLDRVGGHADRLQARRAVAVDGDAGDVAQPGQHGDDAGDVEARLPGRLAAAHDQVLDEGGIELGHLGEQRRRRSAPTGRRGGSTPAIPWPRGRSAMRAVATMTASVMVRSYRRVTTPSAPERGALSPARRRGSVAGTTARSARCRRTVAAWWGRWCRRPPPSRLRTPPRR